MSPQPWFARLARVDGDRMIRPPASESMGLSLVPPSRSRSPPAEARIREAYRAIGRV
jgi:hypothetical protein